MSDTLIIAVAIFAGLYGFAMVAFILFRRYMGLREKQLKTENARLDDFRAHLERQLMEMNERFASSESRWRELNHLVIAGQRKEADSQSQREQVQSSDFLQSHGIDVKRIERRADLIFVLTPFHDQLRDEFEAIVQVGQELGFTVSRGDEKATPGDIFPQLLRLIVQARVIIANISGRNPNVFYELGIAHALDKPVVLISQSSVDIPFDVRAKQIVFYSSNDDLREKLATTLARVLINRKA